LCDKAHEPIEECHILSLCFLAEIKWSHRNDFVFKTLMVTNVATSLLRNGQCISVYNIHSQPYLVMR